MVTIIPINESTPNVMVAMGRPVPLPYNGCAGCSVYGRGIPLRVPWGWVTALVGSSFLGRPVPLPYNGCAGCSVYGRGIPLRVPWGWVTPCPGCSVYGRG